MTFQWLCRLVGHRWVETLVLGAEVETITEGVQNRVVITDTCSVCQKQKSTVYGPQVQYPCNPRYVKHIAAVLEARKARE